jgi:hypothetical protein
LGRRDDEDAPRQRDDQETLPRLRRHAGRALSDPRDRC